MKDLFEKWFGKKNKNGAVDKNAVKKTLEQENIKNRQNVYADTEKYVNENKSVKALANYNEYVEKQNAQHNAKEPDLSDVEKLEEDNGRVILLKNLAVYSIYRKLLLPCCIAFVCLLVTIFGFSSLYNPEPQISFVQTNKEFQFVEEKSIYEQHVSDTRIMTKTIDIAMGLNNYTWLTFKRDWEKVQGEFTAEGWQRFERNLLTTGNLNTIKEGQFIVTSEILGKPTILNKANTKDENYGFVWRSAVPIKIVYTPTLSGKGFEKMEQKGVVHVYFRQVPLKISAEGFLAFRYQLELN